MNTDRPLRTAILCLVLGGGLVGLLTGCASPAPTIRSVDTTSLAPLTPLPPYPPLEQTFDYTQRPLNFMGEEERAAYIARHFAPPKGLGESERGPQPPGRPPGKEFDHRLVTDLGPSQPSVVRAKIDPDLAMWTPIGPDYSPFAEVPPYYDPTYDRYVHHERRYSFPANTIFFGTLGGIIGHQYDYRDEGIFYGASYGLLLDLLSW